MISVPRDVCRCTAIGSHTDTEQILQAVRRGICTVGLTHCQAASTAGTSKKKLCGRVRGSENAAKFAWDHGGVNWLPEGLLYCSNYGLIALVGDCGDTVLHSLQRYTLGHFLADHTHLTHGWIQPFQLRPVLAAVLSNCIPSLHHHVVRDLGGPHDDCPSAQAREDERVVSLANGNAAAVRQWNIIEGATAGDQGPVVGPLDDVFRESLHVGVGVGQGQDDGSVAVGSNSLDDFLRELP
mmetsp:Transcript_46854/g.76936  ORF Transcript_46854/g.76936 Transcript_46854/m.76936 type:complete len:239 (-) Transcript_46854:1281-1997(-)